MLMMKIQELIDHEAAFKIKEKFLILEVFNSIKRSLNSVFMAKLKFSQQNRLQRFHYVRVLLDNIQSFSVCFDDQLLLSQNFLKFLSQQQSILCCVIFQELVNSAFEQKKCLIFNLNLLNQVLTFKLPYKLNMLLKCFYINDLYRMVINLQPDFIAHFLYQYLKLCQIMLKQTNKLHISNYLTYLNTLGFQYSKLLLKLSDITNYFYSMHVYKTIPMSSQQSKPFQDSYLGNNAKKQKNAKEWECELISESIQEQQYGQKWYTKMIKVCQSLRSQNKQLIKINQQLQLRLNFYEQEYKNIQNSSDLNKQNDINQSLNCTLSLQKQLKAKNLQYSLKNKQEKYYMEKLELLQKEYETYKEQIYLQYKKQIKEIQCSFGYLQFCYREYLGIQKFEQSAKNKKIKSLISNFFDQGQSTAQNNSNMITKLIKLYKQANLEQQNYEINNYSQLWMGIDEKQCMKLRGKINQLKNIIEIIISQHRLTIQNMKQEIEKNNEIIATEVRKCMKKYMKGGQNKNIKIVTIESTKQSSAYPPSVPSLIPTKHQGKISIPKPNSAVTPKNISKLTPKRRSLDKITANVLNTSMGKHRKSVKY